MHPCWRPRLALNLSRPRPIIVERLSFNADSLYLCVAGFLFFKMSLHLAHDHSTPCDCPRKERDMGTMSPFMLKMGTVGTALIGPVLPANGASPEIGNQLDLTVGERTHVAALQHKHANRRSFSQQRHAEHGVVFADFFWCSIIRYSRNEPISAIRSSC